METTRKLVNTDLMGNRFENCEGLKELWTNGPPELTSHNSKFDQSSDTADRELRDPYHNSKFDQAMNPKKGKEEETQFRENP